MRARRRAIAPSGLPDLRPGTGSFAHPSVRGNPFYPNPLSENADVGSRRAGTDCGRGRPPGEAQCAGAGGDAGARRRQQLGAGGDRRHRRHHARPRQGAGDAADQHLGAGHVGRHAADGRVGAAAWPAHRAADRHCQRRADRADLLRRRAAGLVSPVQHRRRLQRLLCVRPSVLSLRRRRYRERGVPAEGDLVGADRRRPRRRRRRATGHRHQGSLAALSLRRDLYRAVGARPGRGRRADVPEHPEAAAALGSGRRPPARRDRESSRASSWRSFAASRPIR